LVDVPRERVRDGRNELTLRTARINPASALAERPQAIPEHWSASLELRYVIVEPLLAPAAGREQQGGRQPVAGVVAWWPLGLG